ncbi:MULTISPECIES: GerAB/ArcD/ProY family transporter [Bacillus cereus group]|uniref:Spore gernimation protein n=1 Tax=Bacillus cereus TaxID=1396 RepID=A0AA44QC68_BACCE|nr:MULTISPECIES: endospore germination permease [Bacillus cereus group]PFN06481.1 spore gernimation protein [Bacillus cereus]PFO84691.1 spore gernimation protein [Bacillus cereus]PFR20047.1 spore gernimation protein [Bacillus cereus]PFS02937.1 spore gernimation protein [Bacillus cereus]PGZ12745.1 spore gernimation protein [Bacillus cereus]
MKKYAYNDITLMQYIFLINGMQVGTGVLSLPRVLAEKAGTDGWIAILIGWVLSTISGVFIVTTAAKYPEDTIYDILIRFFGKIVGKVLVIIYMIYFVFYSCIVLINAMLYLKGWLLPKTPDYLVIFLFSIPTFLIARNGPRILGRYSELTFYTMLWLPLFFLIPLKEGGSWLPFFPLLKEGWGPVFTAVPTTIFAYLGFDIAFFLYPYLQKKQYAVHGMVIANTLTMLFYLFATIVCFAYFSPDSITQFNQPVLNLLKVIEFRFLERFDMILLAVYLTVVSTAWIPCIYCAVFCSNRLLGKQNYSSHVVVLLLLIISFVFWTRPSWNQAEAWQQVFSNAGLWLTYILPIILWMYGWLYEKSRQRRIH